MPDEERLIQVANLFADELQTYGLRRVKSLRRSDSDTGGWGVNVADWSQERPKIRMWLDKALGPGKRLFWFGFLSPKRDRISTLVNELRTNPAFPEPASITDEDWVEAERGDYDQLRESASERIKNSGGLFYEKYADSDDVDKFGICECAFNYHSDKELVAQAARFIGDVVEHVDPSLAQERDIKEIREFVKDPTDRQALILARRGQGKFRSDLFDLWEGCAVTKCTFPDVLRASHIKPWKKCDGKDQRLDKYNGLLLSATLDALFDRGLISFDDEGVIMVSSRIEETDRKLLGLDRPLRLSKPLCAEQCEYLKYHRKLEFEPRNHPNMFPE